jgi:hypothetical protein
MWSSPASATRVRKRTFGVPWNGPEWMDEVPLLNGSDPTDQTFIDVAANCAIEGD